MSEDTEDALRDEARVISTFCFQDDYFIIFSEGPSYVSTFQWNKQDHCTPDRHSFNAVKEILLDLSIYSEDWSHVDPRPLNPHVVQQRKPLPLLFLRLIKLNEDPASQCRRFNGPGEQRLDQLSQIKLIEVDGADLSSSLLFRRGLVVAFALPA